MKYFYDQSDFTFLNKLITDEFVDTVMADYREYVAGLNDKQKLKYEYFLNSPVIKHYMTFLRFYNKHLQTNIKTRLLFDPFFMDFNKFDHELLPNSNNRDPEHEEAVDIGNAMESGIINTNVFGKTFQYLKKYGIHGVAESVWELKKGFVQREHKHDPTHSFLHILLEDLTEGEFVVNVGPETRILKKKKDFCLIDTINLHSATFSAPKANTFVMCLQKGEYEQL